MEQQKDYRVGFSVTVPSETFKKLERMAEQRRLEWHEMIEKLIEEYSKSTATIFVDNRRQI